MEQGHRLEQRSRHELRLELKELLKLELSLRSPEFPEAKKGIAGLETADNVLKQDAAIGVLIGGVARDIWKQTRSEAELEQHKDVDVLVLSRHFELTKPFQDGIDWWMPDEGTVDLPWGTTQQNWWINGNGAILRFDAKVYPSSLVDKLPAGLYLIPPEAVVEMKIAEVESAAEVSVSDDAFDALRASLEKNMGNRLMPGVRQLFGNRILNDISFESIEREYYLGIHKHLSG